jgi:hypothetical protein
MSPVQSHPRFLSLLWVCCVGWSTAVPPANADQKMLAQGVVDSSSPSYNSSSSPSSVPSSTPPSIPSSSPSSETGTASAKSPLAEPIHEPSQQVTNAELVSLLRSTKVLDPSSNLAVTISGDEISITTQRKANGTDSECKIKAVLLSKTAFDALPTGPQRCRCTFTNFDTNSYSEVTVKRAEVKMFGAGKLSQKDLLSSLELVASKPVESESADSPVAPGPMQTDRMMTLRRINLLKQKGTNVAIFQRLFDQVEEEAKKDQIDQVKQQLVTLNGHLKDQEQMLKSAATLSATKQTVETKSGDSTISQILQMAAEHFQQHEHHEHHDHHEHREPEENLSPQQLTKYKAEMKVLYESVNNKLKLLASKGFDTKLGVWKYNMIMDLLKDQQWNSAMKQMRKLNQEADDNLRQLSPQQKPSSSR